MITFEESFFLCQFSSRVEYMDAGSHGGKDRGICAKIPALVSVTRLWRHEAMGTPYIGQMFDTIHGAIIFI